MLRAVGLGMPAPAEILRLLTTMTRELSWLATTWHVLLLAAVLWRVSRAAGHERSVSLLLTLLPLSVAATAALYRNPFNAVSFGLLSVALATTTRLRHAPTTTPSWAAWTGGALLLFGWCYPHFVAGPWYRTLYAAPLGVVPCPTLAVLAGLTLLAGGLGTVAAPALLALWSAFYALFGIFQLGVYLDAGLLAAAAALLARAIGMRPQQRWSWNASALTRASQRRTAELRGEQHASAHGETRPHPLRAPENAEKTAPG